MHRVITDLELRLNPLARADGSVALENLEPADGIRGPVWQGRPDEVPGPLGALLADTLRRAREPLDGPTQVMGILNVTPDSFSDGGRFVEPARAIEQGRRMWAAGAAIIDVGGESTRPGAEPVDPAEERRRVLPVVEALARERITVSIDTRRASTARAALEAGATIINDVSALADPEMAPLAARAGASVILMHMQGEPRTMQEAPAYEDVVSEVARFLRIAAKKALSAGVPADRIRVDPGIGFGKRLEHNLELLRRLPELRSLGFGLVVGTSRKRFIGEILDRPVERRRWGTAASVAAAVLRGARCVRVHDVEEMIEVVRLADRLRRPDGLG
jgi:dihydropteroate synthase